MTITADELRKLIHYDPETGIFTWLPREVINPFVATWNTKYAGKSTGSIGSHGYPAIGIHGIKYLSHRLAWLYMTGEWPPKMIDHKDTKKINTKWDNLRCATREQNYANKGLSNRNTSGFKGIYLHKHSGLWHATSMRNRKKLSLGYFTTPEEAAMAYAAFAKDFDGEFAHKSIIDPQENSLRKASHHAASEHSASHSR